MDARSEQFAAELYASFKIEAVEHLKGISDGLLALENPSSSETNQEIVDTIFREAHSLKGAARAVNKLEMQQVCQSLEDVLSEQRKGVLKLQADDFDTLHATVSALTQLLEGGEANISSFNDLTGRLQSIISKKSAEKVEEAPAQVKETVTPYGTVTGDPTIRVGLHKLDKLMQQVEEFTLFKLITSQRYRSLAEMSKKLNCWKNSWGQVQADLRKMRQAYEGHKENYVPSKELIEFIEEQSAFIGDFEEKLLKQSKHSGQDMRLATSMIDVLLEDTKTILMLPFSSAFDLFPKMVRDISRTLNKNVSIMISGGDVEVDRKILEEMKDPLIHLIRNCIDHGIESPEKRQENNKDPQGRIIISALQAGGNRVEITICDDGAGIDVEEVKKKAVSSGLVSESEIERMTEEEIIRLIFKSGLSTNSIITEFSGRGVGMGVVLEKVEKLNGTIKVQTKKNVGTTFLISLPLTIATFRGVYVKAGAEEYIFPTQYLVRVLRMQKDQLQLIEGKQSITIQGHHYAYISLSELLGNATSAPTENKYVYILLIKVTETTFAVGVDSILLEQEVLIKSLGNQLKKIQNIAGVTITDEGKVVLILDPFDMKNSLQKDYRSSADTNSKLTTEKKQYTIMVAEDSSTARMLLKNILESAGYIVKTSVNGAEAFSNLKTEKVDLLVSDVEMPRMDGFELTKRLRDSEQFKNLPIVLCTSRGSQEDKEHGIEVGANAYIDKNSFQQGHLLDIISKLL